MNTMHPFYQPGGTEPLHGPEPSHSPSRSPDHQDFPAFFNDDPGEPPMDPDPDVSVPTSKGYIYEYHPTLNGKVCSILYAVSNVALL